MLVTRLTVARLTVAAAATFGTAATAAVPAHADLGAPAGTQTRTVTRHPAHPPALTAIRTGRHAGYDRVVLDLRGAAPGYRVGYVREVSADPSGRTVAMPGSAYLSVRLTPATAHTATGARTYTGPNRFAVDDPNLRGVAVTGDFEGVVSVALGLNHKAGFRVLTLTNPTRVVVDVAH